MHYKQWLNDLSSRNLVTSVKDSLLGQQQLIGSVRNAMKPGGVHRSTLTLVLDVLYETQTFLGHGDQVDFAESMRKLVETWEGNWQEDSD